jgi:hypothetical protein
MHIDIDKRIASTINGLKEKYDLNLDEKEVIKLIDTIKNELNFGNTELECEIVRMLMALHTIDEDENCSHFYTDVQEILDDLYMSEGHAPIKDADFKNALNALVLSGHIEESRKLHLKNNKVLLAIRINIDFKYKTNKITQDKIKEVIANKLN